MVLFDAGTAETMEENRGSEGVTHGIVPGIHCNAAAGSATAGNLEEGGANGGSSDSTYIRAMASTNASYTPMGDGKYKYFNPGNPAVDVHFYNYFIFRMPSASSSAGNTSPTVSPADWVWSDPFTAFHPKKFAARFGLGAPVAHTWARARVGVTSYTTLNALGVPAYADSACNALRGVAPATPPPPAVETTTATPTVLPVTTTASKTGGPPTTGGGDGKVTSTTETTAAAAGGGGGATSTSTATATATAAPSIAPSTTTATTIADDSGGGGGVDSVTTTTLAPTEPTLTTAATTTIPAGSAEANNADSKKMLIIYAAGGGGGGFLLLCVLLCCCCRNKCQKRGPKYEMFNGGAVFNMPDNLYIDEDL